MIVLYDTTGITVKRRIQDEDHVRIGVLETSLWKDGVRRGVRKNVKLHVDMSGLDFTDLLNELERLP